MSDFVDEEQEAAKQKQAKQDILSLFESFSEDELKRFGARIELDRQENSFNLPHQVILDMLRPFLAAIRAPRIYTPQRILCVPFEDFLRYPDPEMKTHGALGRGSIMPLWMWITGDLAAAEMQSLSISYVEAQKDGDQPQAQSLAKEIWLLCSNRMNEAFTAAEAEDARREHLVEKLGGPLRYEEIFEIVKILRIAPEIEALKELLPLKPIVTLTPDHVTAIADAYRNIAETNPGCELYLILAILGRMLQPFPVLKVFRLLSRDRDDSFVQRTDLSIAGDIVIAALEDDARQVAASIESDAVDEGDIVRKAARFAAAFKGITTDISIRRDGAWGKRMFGSRAIVSKAVEEKVLNGALEMIKSSLPESSGSITEQLEDWPDDDLFERAERRAKALRETVRISDQLGLKAASSSAVTDLRRTFDDFGVRLVHELKTVDPSFGGQAHANMCVVVRLMELITNSDQADLLRRRGQTALRDAAEEALA